VLLLHAGSSSKESWWQPDGYEYGAALTKSLLEAGYAVFALDAQGHGERAAGVDFVPIPALFYTNNWWAAFRTLAVETATDCRRALQYLGTRPEIDLTRLATVGQSLGALGSFYLAAVDPRVAVLVAGAPAVAESWLYPITGLNLAPAVRGRATLLLAGDHDQFASRERLAALRALLGPATEVREFPSDHRLPPAYVDASLNWIRRHLGR
jgi:dienelactone hydrolase